jgi:PleD family two-component response regulator
MTAFHDTEQTHCPAKTTTRILVIDDDACVSMAIQAILARRQYETVIASRADAGMGNGAAESFESRVIHLADTSIAVPMRRLPAGGQALSSG